jgi:protein involved in polysaccharide export with SLBB domain
VELPRAAPPAEGEDEPLPPFAALEEITWRRAGNGAEIRVRLDDLLNKGRIEENIRMLPGDVLIIPESVF